MSSRSAEATIKGYFYQFDTTILKLLELVNDTDKIFLERIEDIDIQTELDTTAVQCKYLSKPKLINSAVREPITLMLDHFLNHGKENLNYTLYAHFEEEIGGQHFDIDLNRLKDILSYKELKVAKAYHTDNHISDTKLENFLMKFKLIFGEEFESQQKKVLNKIKLALDCDDYEADVLHYNNALRLIIERSCLDGTENRVINKAEFLDRLRSSVNLFNAWYIKLRSKSEYLKMIKTRYVVSKAEVNSKSKVIFIGEELLNANNEELPITAFIENLIYKYFRLKHCYRNAIPLTVVLEANNSAMKQIKKDLASSGHLYNDGYEDVAFNGDFFNGDPIINLNQAGNRINKASFVIKITSKKTFEDNIEKINGFRVVIHFSKKTCSYKKSVDFHLFDIKHCANLQDLSTILL